LFLLLFAGSSFTYKTISWNQPNAGQSLSVEVDTKQPQTASSNDGSLKIVISGGTAPYTAQVISTYNPAQVYQTERIEIKKLGAGNYIIIVQDAAKHVVQKTIDLTPVQ